MVFFFSSRSRHTRWPRDWSSDVCSSDLIAVIRIIIAWERRASLGQHNAGFLRQLPHARGGAVNNIDGNEIATFRFGPSRNSIRTHTALQNLPHTHDPSHQQAKLLAHTPTPSFSSTHDA